jgi:aminoglycoside 3-N-acetyltransferase I
MEYAFKKLGNRDLQSFKELLKVFGEAFGEMAVYQDAIPSDDYLTRLLDKPDFIAIVAISENMVVGGLAAYVLKKFEQERKEIYIYDLAVSEIYRRKGIARGLINKLKNIAKEIKAYVIYVQADPGDDPALKLYESMGIKEDVYHFDIKVDNS